MSGLTFALSDGTSFLPDNLPGLKKYIYSALNNEIESWNLQIHPCGVVLPI